MDILKIRPGDLAHAGGAYAQVSDDGDVRLAAWSGSTEIALNLTAEQADALGAQLVNRTAAAVTHVFGNAELFNGTFDTVRNPA